MKGARHPGYAVTGQNAGFRLDEIPASILVIVTRRIGDVLLTAPLIRSLKAA